MLMLPPSLSMPVDEPIILNSLTAVPKPCYHVAYHQELNICCLLHLGNVSQWNFSSVQIDQWWSNDLPLSEARSLRLGYIIYLNLKTGCLNRQYLELEFVNIKTVHARVQGFLQLYTVLGNGNCVEIVKILGNIGIFNIYHTLK